MMKQVAANDNWPGWPRGMRRAVAAAYLGISSSHFDAQRRAGAIPEPKRMFGVELYDRVDLDALFASGTGQASTETNYWDSVCAANENHGT